MSGDTLISMRFAAVAAWLRRTRWWAIGGAILVGLALDLLAGLPGLASTLLPIVIVLVWWVPGLETVVVNFRRGLHDR